MGEFPVSNPLMAAPLLSPAKTASCFLAKFSASSIVFTGIIVPKFSIATVIVVLALRTSTIIATSLEYDLSKLSDTFIITPKIELEKKN